MDEDEEEEDKEESIQSRILALVPPKPEQYENTDPQTQAQTEEKEREARSPERLYNRARLSAYEGEVVPLLMRQLTPQPPSRPTSPTATPPRSPTAAARPHVTFDYSHTHTDWQRRVYEKTADESSDDDTQPYSSGD
jgi:hypothetical protein